MDPAGESYGREEYSWHKQQHHRLLSSRSDRSGEFDNSVEQSRSLRRDIPR